MKPSLGRGAGSAFAVAALIMLPFWWRRYRMVGSPFDAVYLSNHYHYPDIHRLDDVAGLIFLVLLMLGLFVADRLLLARPGPRETILGIGALALAVYGLNFVRIMVSRFLQNRGLADWFTELATSPVVLAIVVLVALIVSVRYFGKLSSTVRRLSGTGVLVGAVIVLNAVSGAARLGLPVVSGSATGTTADAAVTANATGRRVIWMLFDGMDQTLSFDRRDRSVDLSAFDWLRSHSFHATQARSPGTSTLSSIPGLFTGKVIEEFRRQPRELLIRPRGKKEFVRWTEQPTVLHDMRKRGVAGAVLSHDLQGHPYCRLFAGLTSACWDENEWSGQTRSALDRLPAIFASLMRFVPFVGDYFLAEIDRPFYQRARLMRFKQAVIDTVENDRFGFVYVHWMLPHGLSFYDRDTNSFAPHLMYPERFWDNLELADITFADVMKSIRQRSSDRPIALIVSADHGRTAERPDHAVFMAWLSDETSPVQYDGAIDTVATRELIAALIAGRIKSYGDIGSFFDNRRRNFR